MIQEITTFVSTLDDVHQFRDEILQLKSALYKTDTTQFDTVLETRVRKRTADQIRSVLPKSTLNREHALNELEKKLDALKPVVLTLAFEPTERFAQKVATFVRTHISPDTVISVRSDPSIIGGAIISFDGYYKDFSIIKQLDGDIAKTKQESN